MTVSLVKKVARNIRYHVLPDWVGKQVVIYGVDSIEHDVKRGLDDPLLEQSSLIESEPRFWQLALAKYDLLDLSFAFESEWIWRNETNGIGLLKSLHLVPPSVEDDLVREFQLDMLNQLADNISTNKVYIKLFLRSKRSSDTKRVSLPDNYFPRTFVVEDACLANTDWAWFNKHFYV